MRKSDWVAERWLLRYVSLRGFAIPGNETFDAAIRAGGAGDRMTAARALDALLRLQLLVQAASVVMLTPEGERAADEASRFAASLGEPGVPVPESHLPTIVWAEADFEMDDVGVVDNPPEKRMLQARPKQEEPMKTAVALERERFSLDDPEAGRKLAANLDARKVRLAFSELCWHFRCDDGEDRIRLRTFLEALKSDGTLVEPEQKLFCRPALAHGATGDKRRKAVAKAKRHFRRMTKDVSVRDAQAASLLAFIVARGEATVSALKDEAARLAFPDGRVNYIIQHLRETSKIERISYGTYRLASEAQAPPVSEPVP